MDTNFSVSGELVLTLKDEHGAVKDQRTVKNLVVTTGREYIASRMIGTSAGIMSHIAIGTGIVDPVAGQGTLGTEIDRNALSTAATVSGPTVSYSALFPAGEGTGAITEAGIFNAASVGTMLCRTKFNVINKGPLDTLTINWNVTINAS